MAKYLLDTNIYINFYDRCYRFSHFPSFWQTFASILNQKVIIPKIIIEENYQDSNFREWLNRNYQGSYLNHKLYAEQWGEVHQHIADHDCYSEKALTNSKSWTHESIADGWIIAIAKRDNLVIVCDELRNTNLNSKNPSQYPKIPDIADDLGIRCINMNEFFEEIELKI